MSRCHQLRRTKTSHQLRRTKTALFASRLLWALLPAVLSGCSGGEDGAADAGPATDVAALDAAAADTGKPDLGGGPHWGSDAFPLPESAEIVSEAQLEQLGQDGTLVEIKPGFLQTEAAALAKAHADHKAFVDDFVAKNPGLAKRLEAPPLASDVTQRKDGNYEFRLTNHEGEEQTIVTLGPKVRTATLAAMLRTGGTKENQLKIFNTLYATTPISCRSSLPDPKTIDGLSAEELTAANNKMGQCWRDTMIAEKQVRGMPVDPPPGHVSDPAQYSGAPSDGLDEHNGDSTGKSCSHSSDGMWLKMSWKNKAADTSVKNQASRGTCTAFGMVGAVENLVARGGDYVNLSEQALYAFGRLQSGAPPDGLWPHEVVGPLIASGFAIPYEQKWVYNPSPGRKTCGSHSEPGHFLSCEPGELDWGYRYSCAPLNSALQYNGPACSNTAHQAKLVCAGSGSSYQCHWWTPKWSVGFKIADSIEWLNADCLKSSACWSYVSQALWSGWSAVVSIDVWKYWKKMPESGYPKAPPADPQFLGTHTLQISGWVFNHELPADIPPSQGSGYYIIKNSWGSCWGDGGYAYLSDAWMVHNVLSIVGLSAQPAGFNNPPSIKIVSPADESHHGYGGLLGSIHFVAEPDDVEDGPSGCTVKWYKDSMSNYVGEGTEIDISFDSPGLHRVFAAVEDTEFGQAKVKVSLILDNDPPTATITTPTAGAKVYRGQTVMLNGTGFDMNEPSFGCSALSWTSSVAGDPFPVSGCSAPVVFSTNGSRVLTLTATDAAGDSGTDTVSINVVDPPLNAPPTVTITSPKHGSGHDESAHIALVADVKDPDGVGGITYRWTVQRAGFPETDIGATKSMTWRYLDTYSCPCLTPDVTIRLYAKDTDGTNSDAVTVAIICPPC